MTVKVIQLKYKPRAQLGPFHERQQRFALIVAHRRFGKTVGVVNDMVVRALRTPKQNAFYAYVAPYFGQAKQAAWTYIKEAVRDVPGTKIIESETSVLLPNGAKVRVFGADNADSLRGLYFDGIVLDEFGDMAGRVWSEVIRPALADRKGWAVFIGTPRGKNKFYEMRELARKNERGNWFYLEIKASESGVLPDDELASLREELDANEYLQELECSFDATIRGSYYGDHMTALFERGALELAPYDSSEPVSLAMDIGFADAASIWFWQVIDGEVRFIDYWEETGYDAQEVVDVLELKPYAYETWWLPHDAKHKTFQSKKSVLDTFRDFDAPAKIVPNLDLKDGIDAVRKTLRTYPLRFDMDRCCRGIEALKNYSRKWDEDRKVFDNKPKHDQWSHGADAFRYAALVINRETIQGSVERAQRKRQHKQRLAAVPANQPVNRDYQLTLDQAWAAREQQLASQRAAGRGRI